MPGRRGEGVPAEQSPEEGRGDAGWETNGWPSQARAEVSLKVGANDRSLAVGH